MTATTGQSDAPALYSTQMGTGGPRIAFLHGLFGQGKNWTSIAKILAEQARVIMMDLPNHGQSGWTETVTYGEMAVAVADVLADADDDTLNVVGHSMGGKVAMAMALLQPGLVERLAVVDIAPVRYDRLTGFADYVTGMQSIDLGRLQTRAEADTQLQPYVPD